MHLSRLVRGIRTVILRRGAGYLGRVVARHYWPQAMYRYVLGPAALPALGRAAEAVDRSMRGLRTRRALREAGALRADAPRTRRADAPSIVRTFDGAAAFAEAWLAYARLQDEAGVPSIVSVDPARRRLVLSQTEGAPVGRSSAPPAESLGLSLDRLVDRIHRRGVTGLRHALDALVVTADGSVALAEIPRARVHAQPRGAWFRHERDRDRRAINDRFGLSLLTDARARELLAHQQDRLPPGWFREYAPIDFGDGLAVGRFQKTDSGTGRWEFFNSRIVAPLVAGKRVLDLGSNNGSLPIMMLRAGAREVVAVERSEILAESAELNARVLAWRDMRPYELRLHRGDMRDCLTQPWGPFDVVTAFCSIYYLPHDDIAAIIRTAAGMGAVLVVQANDGANENLPEARHAFLRRMMEANGYPRVAMHAVEGFARPLLVGAPRAAATSANATLAAAV
jgi:SAM-dependent methyltransferase